MDNNLGIFAGITVACLGLSLWIGLESFPLFYAIIMVIVGGFITVSSSVSMKKR